MGKRLRTKNNILLETDVEKIKGSISKPRDRLLFFGLLYTGMRISEFIHMHGDWIDWDENWIAIPESMECGCRECRALRGGVWGPKTKSSVRRIPILPEVRGILENYFAKHDSIMEAVPHRVLARYYLMELGKKAGVGKALFPHCLRGTFASILAGKGFDPLSIQATLGWASLKTADEYIKISPYRLKKIFEAKW